MTDTTTPTTGATVDPKQTIIPVLFTVYMPVKKEMTEDDQREIFEKIKTIKAELAKHGTVKGLVWMPKQRFRV